MLEISAGKIALLVADGTSVSAVITEFEQRFPDGIVIHVGYSAHRSLPMGRSLPTSLFPLINIRGIVSELKDAGVTGIAYAGDLGLLRENRLHRLHGRSAEFEDDELSRLLEQNQLNIEAVLARVVQLLTEAEMRRVHLSAIIPDMKIKRGWLVKPEKPLVEELFEERIRTLTQRIHQGDFANFPSARTTFVFDGTRLVSPIEQSTDLVLSHVSRLPVPNDVFRSLVKISTAKSSVDISAPTVGKTTFEGAKDANVRLVVLDADCGIFAQQDRTVEYCLRNEIAVYGFSQQFLTVPRRAV